MRACESASQASLRARDVAQAMGGDKAREEPLSEEDEDETGMSEAQLREKDARLEV